MSPSPPDKSSHHGQNEERAWQRALYFLGIKSRTVREVERYLEIKGYTPKSIAAVVGRLEREGYLDDQKLAHQVARKAPEKGWSSFRTTQELIKRGVDRGLAREVVEEVYGLRDLQVALRQGRKKLSSLPQDMDDEKIERKVAMYLNRKGFPPPIIIEVLDKLREERNRILR